MNNTAKANEQHGTAKANEQHGNTAKANSSWPMPAFDYNYK